MTAPNRVDELRKRYHENPRRFFAPLANEFRKSGFVDRAILLCEKHLGEQPGNMNGLVVYGQCLFETGRLDDARQPFEMALGVDPENLIALRYLGDIARLGGDHPAAKGWYERVLEVDRRNEEVIALLAEVGGGGDDAPSASQAPSIVSVGGSVRVTSTTPQAGMIELEPPPAATPTPTREIAAEPAPRSSTPMRAATPARPSTPARPVTPLRSAAPVDPSAKTVEVSAQPKPAKRASLLDVAFDFGELGVEAAPAAPPPAPEPLLPSEAAEYGFAAPESTSNVEDEIDALDAFVSELPSAPLIEAAPDHQPLAAMPEIEGIEKAEFSADVSPLAGLEVTDQSTGEVSPLDGLDPTEFQPPDRPSAVLEGLESDEFQPLGLEESGAQADIGLTHDDPFGSAPMPSEEEEEHALPPMLDADDAHEEHALPPLAMDDDVDAIVESPSALPELPAMPEDLADIDDLAIVDEHAAPADPRTSMAGLPLLEPFGTPTPLETPTVSDLPLLPSLEDAVTVPVDLAAARRAMETPATFVTETMAQVYVQQGHLDKAIEVYRQLITQSPDDTGLQARLRALEMQSMPTPVVSSTPIMAATPVVSATPIMATPKVTPAATPPQRQTLDFGTPSSVEPIDEPAPANAMLKATSFDGISLTTPGTGPRTSKPLTDTPATGPSAREFFSRFAHRAATPQASPVVAMSPAAAGKLLSPLDELFGPGVAADDEAAAHRLAGVGATSGPSGGSALDSLFGEGPSAPMPTTTPSRGTVPRASDKLRFDQFFSATAEAEAVQAPAPEPMADPVSEPHSAESDPEAGQPGEDDDLDQFHGWLRGLTS